MRIKAKTTAIAMPLIFLLGIGFTMLNGYWQTESSKIPSKIQTGELKGEYDPADLRGSYSLGDIEKAFDISVETLAKAFGVSGREDLASVQIKEFEEFYGIINGREVGTDSMRLFVALYLNIPYISEEGTALPQPAYNILKKEASLSEDQLSELSKRVVSLEGLEIATEGTTEESHEESVEQIVKGKTLFADLYEWGLTEEQVLQAFDGGPVGTRAMSVRDFCTERGIEFSIVKEKLQNMIDS